MEECRKVVKYGLFAAMVTGLVLIGFSVYQYRSAEDSYQEARQLANMTIPAAGNSEENGDSENAETLETMEYKTYERQSYMTMLKQINVDKLKEINADVVGWIVIPNTQIAYPLMGGAGNGYYLDHTWRKESNSSGAIFVEEKNNLDFQNHNTIIYGHRMRNGSMFGSLKEYQKQEYWEEHPEIYIRVDDACFRYEIFAAYEASVSGRTYQVGFENEESKQLFLDDCLGRSVIETGIVPRKEDRILTLSTCTGRGYSTRWVVQARLAETD